jgi:spore coat polysaccharide biosynthesis protein SpsF
LQPTYPDGLDVEVCRFPCLQQAWEEATLPSQREHVTPFLHQQPERFQIQPYKGPVDLSYLRWTVDEAADFELVTAIYQALYPTNPAFTTQDVLTFLQQHPEWLTHNTQYQRNEGLQKSFLEDALFLQNRER